MEIKPLISKTTYCLKEALYIDCLQPELNAQMHRSCNKQNKKQSNYHTKTKKEKSLHFLYDKEGNF